MKPPNGSFIRVSLLLQHTQHIFDFISPMQTIHLSPTFAAFVYFFHLRRSCIKSRICIFILFFSYGVFQLSLSICFLLSLGCLKCAAAL